MATRLRSFSKVNLGLRIGPVRPDGFHELATMYQTLALHDSVTVSARRLAPGEPARLTLTTDHPRVPIDDRNTAWQMVERALAALGASAEVSIHIEKRLPVQGGLGAGSANAAAALIALERELLLWDPPVPKLSQPERLRFAAEVGSDVPLFLVGGTILGQGRGEVVSPMPDMKLPGNASGPTVTAGVPCVVAVPKVGVSTPFAFRDWDARHSSDPGLTSVPARDTLRKLSLAYSSFTLSHGKGNGPGTSGIVRDGIRGLSPGLPPDGKSIVASMESRNDLAENTLLTLVHTGIENDFEEVVFPHHPSLRETKCLLMGENSGQPAIYAALSGSGSALFGLYWSEADARAAQQRVQSSGIKAILTETLSREEYWTRMLADVG